MRSVLALPIAVLLSTAPALAADPPAPVTDKQVSAVDVAATPVSDLNIKKDKIPELLLTAQQAPYSLSGLGTCSRLSAEIGRLNAVLGDDIDIVPNGGKRTSAGLVAQEVVGSFIPFRGVIREVSGANGHERDMKAAIVAGLSRRSFLKGTGQAKGCAYPARAVAIGPVPRARQN